MRVRCGVRERPRIPLDLVDTASALPLVSIVRQDGRLPFQHIMRPVALADELCVCVCVQPKQIRDIRDFLQKTHRADAKSVKIKKSKDMVKFKIRCSRFLYTLCVTDLQKADKLTQSLPPGIKRCLLCFESEY